MCQSRLLMAVALLLSLSFAAPLAAQGKGPRERPGKAARVYEDPASTRGESDGYACGLGDGRKGERYDPARHAEYRDAKNGYTASYGARDGYRNNYRDGFRRGYEEGYRRGTRGR